MPVIRIDGLDHYFEQAGKGRPMVFIHGAFADARVWEPQWQHFLHNFQVCRYDLRGHGRTGRTGLAHYSIETFSEDLASLLNALEIDSPILCGLSWGGSVAQAFACRYPTQPAALILVSPAAAIDLTLLDKLLCNFLFPRWAMSSAIQRLGVEKFIKFSLGLARLTRGKHWLSRDDTVRVYLEACMFQMDYYELMKTWEAIYDFHLLQLEKITCPTLVLNGKCESNNTFRHTQELLRRIPRATSRVIPGVSHAANLDRPGEFNAMVDDFLA